MALHACKQGAQARSLRRCGALPIANNAIAVVERRALFAQIGKRAVVINLAIECARLLGAGALVYARGDARLTECPLDS